jgi:hypothetical protein
MNDDSLSLINKMEQSLEYKYDEYEADFHEEGPHDKSKRTLTVEYQAQTEGNQPENSRVVTN